MAKRLDILKQRVEAQAERLVLHVIARLASRTPPPGVKVESHLDGIRLVGRRLKSRMIKDPRIRNFFK